MTYQPGDILLEEYRIEALIGVGAFGEVFRVTNLGLKVPRALKILRRDAPGMGSTAFMDAQARFQLEAQLGAQLNTPTPHPNLLQVHRFKAVDHLLVLEMEYAPGGSLAERLQASRRNGIPLPVTEVAQMGLEVASGLALFHARDVVHRDLKPSNLLFDGQNRVKVADLGLAQVPGGPSMRSLLSNAQPHPGTPEYMSPEQESSSKHLTPASDVYALGLVLFEMLTNRTYKNVRAGTRSRALRPEVPAWLDDLLASLLAETPRERPLDGSEVADLLRAPLQQQAEQQKAERLARAAAERARLEEENRAAEREQQAREAAGQARREAEQRDQAQKLAQEKARAQAAEKARQAEQAAAERRAQPSILRFWPLGVLGVLGLGAVLLVGLITGAPAATPPPATAEPIATEIPAPGVGSTRKRETDGMLEVYVPAGSFTMGSDNGYDNEKPAHQVNLDAYWIDQTEVTNAMFTTFVGAKSYQTDAEKAGQSYVFNATSKNWEQVSGADWQHPQGPGSSLSGLSAHPVVHVSWNDAVAYCAWAGARLPTEAEWEKAARGPLTGSGTGRTYPWGETAPNGKLLNFADASLAVDWADKNTNDGYQFTAPVGSYPSGASPYGALDMAGNVWEWMDDWYAAYPGNTVSDSNYGTTYKVLRGGSLVNDDYGVRSAFRGRYYPSLTGDSDGFRCVRSN